jgi:hypothetical protein
MRTARNFKESHSEEQFNKLSKDKKAIVNSLIEFEEKNEGKEIVATLYQLGRTGAGFDPAMKKLLRNNCLVEQSFFVKTNLSALEGGKVFVLDEKKTAERNAKAEAWREEQNEKAMLEQEVGEEVANTIKAIGQVAKGKIKAKKKSEE